MSVKDMLMSLKIKDLPDMMAISNDIACSNKLADSLKSSEASMKHLREIVYNNL